MTIADPRRPRGEVRVTEPGRQAAPGRARDAAAGAARTPSRRRGSAAGTAPGRTEPPIWILGAMPGETTAGERARLDEALARVAFGGRGVVFSTCHRVEVLGTGPGIDPALHSRATDAVGAGRLRTLHGTDAVRHAMALAAGLESAVIGEDQVLHQVRDLLDAVDHGHPLDAHLRRLLELAIGVGRRARAERLPDANTQGEHGLAGRAVDWLASEGAGPEGARILVVGTGTMGRLLAIEARSRGATVTVASRDPTRAAALGVAVGGEGVDLAAAASDAASMDGIAVAIGGRWTGLDGVHDLPPTVDLSSPAAVPPGIARRQIDIDGLFVWARRSDVAFGAASVAMQAGDTPDSATGWAAAGATEGDGADFVAGAERLVEESVERYVRWSAGRASVATLRELRTTMETRRVRDLERLLNRLPELTRHERDLVEAFSQQLVAGLLHAPTAALREDQDGSLAGATRQLFGLPPETGR